MKTGFDFFNYMFLYVKVLSNHGYLLETLRMTLRTQWSRWLGSQSSVST